MVVVRARDEATCCTLPEVLSALLPLRCPPMIATQAHRTAHRVRDMRGPHTSAANIATNIKPETSSVNSPPVLAAGPSSVLGRLPAMTPSAQMPPSLAPGEPFGGGGGPRRREASDCLRDGTRDSPQNEGSEWSIPDGCRCEWRVFVDDGEETVAKGRGLEAEGAIRPRPPPSPPEPNGWGNQPPQLTRGGLPPRKPHTYVHPHTPLASTAPPPPPPPRTGTRT